MIVALLYLLLSGCELLFNKETKHYESLCNKLNILYILISSVMIIVQHWNENNLKKIKQRSIFI